MGAGQSTDNAIGGSSMGYQVLRVYPNSPGSRAGLKAYFDFIISIGNTRFSKESGSLREILKASVDQKLRMTVFNTRTRSTREVEIVPSTSWGGNGLLGVSIKHTSFERADERVWHVVDVEPGSPAQQAGFRVGEDYVIGSDSILQESDDLYNLVEAHDGKALKLFLYNVNTDNCREVICHPNSKWGGKGYLGCEFGHGLLHRIPEGSSSGDDENMKAPLLLNQQSTAMSHHQLPAPNQQQQQQQSNPSFPSLLSQQPQQQQLIQHQPTPNNQQQYSVPSFPSLLPQQPSQYQPQPTNQQQYSVSNFPSLLQHQPGQHQLPPNNQQQSNPSFPSLLSQQPQQHQLAQHQLPPPQQQHYSASNIPSLPPQQPDQHQLPPPQQHQYSVSSIPSLPPQQPVQHQLPPNNQQQYSVSSFPSLPPQQPSQYQLPPAQHEQYSFSSFTSLPPQQPSQHQLPPPQQQSPEQVPSGGREGKHGIE